MSRFRVGRVNGHFTCHSRTSQPAAGGVLLTALRRGSSRDFSPPTPDDVESVLAAVETIPPSLFDHYEGSRENEPVRGHDRLHAAQDGERRD